MILLKLRTWYKVHKWISIFTGAAIIVWLNSGIIMVLPGIIPGLGTSLSHREKAPPQYHDISLSPSEAITLLEASLGQSIQEKKVELIQIGNTLVYRVTLADGVTHFMDAQTAQIITITPDFAQKVALEEVPFEANIVQTEKLEHRSFSYIYGELPVFRIILDDKQNTHVYIAPYTGEVTMSDRAIRRQQVFGSFHTFQIVKVLTGSGVRLTTILMWASILLSLFSVLVGYYLALPHRQQIRR